MQCLPYLQGMLPQLTKSFSRALGEDYIALNRSICDRSRASKPRAKAPPFHALLVGQQIARITNE